MKELRDGVNIEEASRVSDARDLGPDEDDIAEVLAMPEDERPWTAAARVAEQEFAKQRDANEESKRAQQAPVQPRRHEETRTQGGFPDLPDDLDDVKQCNEPGLTFRLDDGDDGNAWCWTATWASTWTRVSSTWMFRPGSFACSSRGRCCVWCCRRR